MSEDIEAIESKTLKCLGPGSVRFGHHSVLFVDTSIAWEHLFSIIDSKYHPEITESNDDETDVNELNILPEYARYKCSSVPRRDRDCFFCHKAVSTAGAAVLSTSKELNHNISCRICEKIFHQECIQKRGFCDDEIALTAMSEPSVGWSCPHCEDVYNLLTNDEQEEVSDLFDRIAGNIE